MNYYDTELLSIRPKIIWYHCIILIGLGVRYTPVGSQVIQCDIAINNLLTT